MKALFVSSLLLLCACSLQDQQQQSEALDHCDAMRVSGVVEIRFEQGIPQSLTLFGDAQALAEAEFEQSTTGMSLTSTQPLQAQLRCQRLPEITLLGQVAGQYDGTQPGEFSKIGVYGDSAFAATNVVAADLDLRVSGQGRLAIQNAIAEQIHIQVAGQGELALVGESGELTLNLSGQSKLDASGLQAQTVTVQSRGGSNAVVWATAHLGGDITGNSELRYRGQPDLSIAVTDQANLEAM